MKILFRALITLIFLTAAARADVVNMIDVSKVACAVPCKRAAVIFIHGILGSKETWQNEDTSWPELLASDATIGNELDVYRVDFDSYLLFPGPSIVDVLDGLQEKLDSLLQTKRYKRVFLVGHSLGGTIARAYLLHVKAKYGHRALSTFPITFTLGTPSKGSSLATLASYASQNQQLRVLLPIKVNDFQQLLNQTLKDVLAKHSAVACPSLLVYSAFETQPMGAAGVVVSEESATFESDEKRGFNRNHSTLVKPLDRTDPVYRWVADSMEECLTDTAYCKPIPADCGFVPSTWPSAGNAIAPYLSPVPSAKIGSPATPPLVGNSWSISPHLLDNK